MITKKWYTLQEAMPILEKELGIKDTATAKKFIRKEEPRLKAVIYGEDRGKRYRIKSDWIVEFIAQMEDI